MAKFSCEYIYKCVCYRKRWDRLKLIKIHFGMMIEVLIVYETYFYQNSTNANMCLSVGKLMDENSSDKYWYIIYQIIYLSFKSINKIHKAIIVIYFSIYYQPDNEY